MAKIDEMQDLDLSRLSFGYHSIDVDEKMLVLYLLFLDLNSKNIDSVMRRNFYAALERKIIKIVENGIISSFCLS